MRSSRRHTVPAVAHSAFVLAFLFLSGPATGYEIKARWPNDPRFGAPYVRVQFNADSFCSPAGCPNIEHQLIAATDTWTETSGIGFRFAINRDDSTPPPDRCPDGDGNNTVSMRSGYVWAEGRLNPNVLAVTCMAWNSGTGIISDADIVFSGQAIDDMDRGWSDQYPDGQSNASIRSILTHELGHFLGLDHTDAPEYQVVMSGSEEWPQFDLTEWWYLKRDDILGARALYPPQPQTDKPTFLYSTDGGSSWSTTQDHNFIWPSRYGYALASNGTVAVAAWVASELPGVTQEGQIRFAVSSDPDLRVWELKPTVIDTDVYRGVSLLFNKLYGWLGLTYLAYLKESGNIVSLVKVKVSFDNASWFDGTFPDNVPTYTVPSMVYDPTAALYHLALVQPGYAATQTQTRVFNSPDGASYFWAGGGGSVGNFGFDAPAMVCRSGYPCVLMSPTVGSDGRNVVNQFVGSQSGLDFPMTEVNERWDYGAISVFSPALAMANPPSSVSAILAWGCGYWPQARATRYMHTTASLDPNGANWTFLEGGSLSLKSHRASLMAHAGRLWLLQ